MNDRLSGVNATQRIPCVLMSSRQSVTWFTSVTCEPFRRSSRYLPLRDTAAAVTTTGGRIVAGTLIVAVGASAVIGACQPEASSAVGKGELPSSAAPGAAVPSCSAGLLE